MLEFRCGFKQNLNFIDITGTFFYKSGMSLTDALIPIYDGATPYEAGFRFQADDALLGLAINHLYETAPEKFGDTQLRAYLRYSVTKYLSGVSCRDPFGQPTLLPFLGRLFESYSVNPFADIRLAYLGGSDYFPHSIFGDDSSKLREMFGKFRDFNPTRTQGITSENSKNFLTSGKYDYVITGNVLNDPRVEDVKSVFAGCANMTRPGGLIIHGIGYSNHHYNLILNRVFHDACCQKRIDDNYPKHHGDPERGLVLDAIVMQQNQDVDLSDSHLQMLEKNELIPVVGYNKPSPA